MLIADQRGVFVVLFIPFGPLLFRGPLAGSSVPIHYFSPFLLQLLGL